MILLYPETHKSTNRIKNEGVEIIYYADVNEIPQSISSYDMGLVEKFELVIYHDLERSEFNYSGKFQPSTQTHRYESYIDCRYESKNLKLLINKLLKIENLWNEVN